ncbi:MAG: sulfotransferase family 2 domain-containing protein [Paracoccaceae bacterium]
MIISVGRRYIFVHIPKTGGTSLALALEARAMKDDILIGDTPKARARAGRWKGKPARGRVWKHSKLADVEGLVPSEIIDTAFVVTLVRNPWDRMVSYYHWLRGQRFAHPAVALAKTVDFTGFVLHPDTAASIAANPYDSYCRDSAGRDRATLYARLENLDADLAPFWAHLGFSLSPLPRTNASGRAKDWRSFYTPDTAEALARMAEADIARFGYGFDA